MNLLLAIHFPCWLIPIIVGLISAILGYLLGKFLGGSNKTESNQDVYKNRISKLETDLETCESNKTKLEANLKKALSDASASKTIASSFVAPETIKLPFDSSAAKIAFGKKIKQDDLKVVEGIGPKIEQLFHNFGINTWAVLANTSVNKCQEVLDSGGKRFEIHKPKTWPEQAKMANEGKWQELKTWQDSLDGGK